MVKNFCVKDCFNKCSKPGQESGLRFFRFPRPRKRYNDHLNNLLQRQQDGWFAAVNRKDLKLVNIDNLRVCSEHFIKGEPGDSKQMNHPDWCPSLRLGYEKKKTISPNTALKKYERVVNREVDREIIMEALNEEPEVIIDEHAEYVSSLEAKVKEQSEEIDRLREQLRRLTLNDNAFDEKDPQKVLFFTGLPNLAVILLILEYLEPALCKIQVQNLSSFQKLLLCLMKLRHNDSYRGLSYRFGIPERSASRVFKKVIALLDYTFSHMIHWPARDALRAVTPACFLRNFHDRVAVIIDCFEIQIEKPSTLRGKGQTYSNYKRYGGRISDKKITELCGILDKLLPGDIVLANRGFTIYDLVGAQMAQLKIPDFTKGKTQLLPREVENTRRIAEGPLPIKFFQSKHGDRNLVDYIVRVCGILTNMVESIVIP